MFLWQKNKQIHIESSKLNRLQINIINKSCDSSVRYVWHPPDPLHNICTIDSARDSAISNSHCLLPATAFFFRKNRSATALIVISYCQVWRMNGCGHREATTLFLRQSNSAVCWLISFDRLQTAHKPLFEPHTTAFGNIGNPGPNGKHDSTHYFFDTNTA